MKTFTNLPIFVVSLQHSVDRREKISALLNKIGLTFTFFDAVDGQRLDTDKIENLYDEQLTIRTIGRPLSGPEVGCALSHKAIYKKMIDEAIPRAIILEDDVFFDESFNGVYRWLLAHPMPEDTLLFLKGLQPPDPSWWLVTSLFKQLHINKNTHIRKITSVTRHIRGTCAYYLSSKIARNLHDKIHPTIHIDADNWHHFKRVDCFKELRVVQPDVVYHPDGNERHSYIEEARREAHLNSHPRTFKSKIRNRFHNLFITIRFLFHVGRQIFRLSP